MFLNRSIFLFVFALLIAIPATAQIQNAPKQEIETNESRKDDAQTKLTAQALELLDAVIKDAEHLRLPQNRVYMSLASAELLWNYDEQAARALLRSVVADYRMLLSEPDDGEMQRVYRRGMERSQLREKILFALARRDAQMAIAFLADTKPDVSRETVVPDENEGSLEARLALVIAENDPAQAIEIAQKSLAKGFTYALPDLVSRIREKDPEAATKLASDILAKLKTTNLTTNSEATNVAFRIFQIAIEPQKAKAKPSTDDAKPLLTEQSLRELAELLASAAINGPNENTARPLDIRSIIDELEKYAPSRKAQLRRAYPPDEDNANEEQAWMKYQRLRESGTVETLLEAGDNAEPAMRDSYYRDAAMKLVAEDKSDRARQIINERVKDPSLRKQMLADIDKQSMTVAATNGKIDETRRLLSSAGTNEERITILVQLAMSITEKGDKKLALKLLDEARNLSTGRAKYSRQLVAQLLIARGYASVDATQSLVILEPTIDQLNELIAAGILMGEFFGEEEVVRDDELLVQPLAQIAETFQQQFGKDLALLGAANFTRTRDAAERFQRVEVRLMARLLLAQSILFKKDVEKADLAKPADGKKSIPNSPESYIANPLASP